MDTDDEGIIPMRQHRRLKRLIKIRSSKKEGKIVKRAEKKGSIK